jgi:hypothetical protein
MKTLILESCNNKLNKKPWLAKLSLKEDGEIAYHFQNPDYFEKLTGTKNRYEWDLQENIIYCKGDTYNYSKYFVTSFIIENGIETELTKREVKKLLA